MNFIYIVTMIEFSNHFLCWIYKGKNMEEKLNIAYTQKPEWDNGIGSKKLKKFLQNFCEEFASYSLRYHKALGEFPFVYSERSLTSIVLPSLINNKSTNKETFVFMEHPFKRKNKKKKDIQRFLDFYIDCGDSLYLLEMKHQWNAYKTVPLNNKTFEVWEKCQEQIQDLNNQSINDHMCDLSAYKHAFKIALMIMPVYDTLKDKNTLKDITYPTHHEYYTNIEEAFKANKEETVTQPNFLAVWKIDKIRNINKNLLILNLVFTHISFLRFT